jgi:hypothetical protein
MARLQMFEKPPLRYTDELRAMLSLAAPLVGANLLQMAVFAVDVVFVARLGPVALAAASLSVSLFGLLIWSLSGLVGAAAPLVAAELGQRRHAVREVRRTVRMTGLAGLLGAIVAMGICLLGEPLMRITGQQENVIALAVPFLGVLMWAAIPATFAALLRTFVATMGRPAIGTAHYGHGRRGQCTGQLAVRIRQSGNAGNGPDRLCCVQRGHHLRDADRLCCRHPYRPAFAALSPDGAVVEDGTHTLCRCHAHRPADHCHDHCRGGHVQWCRFPDGAHRRSGTGRAHRGAAIRRHRVFQCRSALRRPRRSASAMHFGAADNAAIAAPGLVAVVLGDRLPWC